MVPKDWHTQTSSLASDEGLLTKLKRLMPIVGCEADAVAFTEDRRAALQPEQGAQTMLPDGSYSTGPVALGDDLAARVEHCLVQVRCSGCSAPPFRTAALLYPIISIQLFQSSER